MVDPVVPTYVRKVGSDGRRYFKREFIDGLLNDIKSGKYTVSSASSTFKIGRTLIERWTQRDRLGRWPQRTQAQKEKQKLADKARYDANKEKPIVDYGRTPVRKKGEPHQVNANGHTNLLARARELEGTVLEKDREVHTWNEVELAAAFLSGEVRLATLKRVMGIRSRRWEGAAWASRVMRWAFINGAVMETPKGKRLTRKYVQVDAE